MIISVSIVDKHRPKGEGHVGTYSFEIAHPNDSHFDLLALVCPKESEDKLRADGMNRLIDKAEMIERGACNGNGEPVKG